MSSVPQGNRYAPPVAHVEDLAVDGDVELAGRGARFAAMIVDGLVLGIVGWGVSALFMRQSMELLRTGALSIVAYMGMQMALWLVVTLVINGYLLATRGQTVGKLMLGIRVVRTDGSRAGLVRLLFVRYFANSLLFMIPLLGVIYFLADSLCIFRESRQCLHDNLADTIVVKA
jgi:uncharacterized RDD family membrane protein YckC